MIFHDAIIKTHDTLYGFVICTPIVKMNTRKEPAILLNDMVIRSDTSTCAFHITYTSILL